METLQPQNVRTPQEVFKSMADINPGRNAIWTAVDEIKDPRTARLFIEGCAEQLALHTEDESIKENPMRVTLGNILYAAESHVVDDPNKTRQQQLENIMKPWYEGYDLVAKSQQVEQ